MRKICLIREIILILHRKSETYSNIRKCAYIYPADEFFQISLVGGIVFWGMVMLGTLAIVHKGSNEPNSVLGGVPNREQRLSLNCGTK